MYMYAYQYIHVHMYEHTYREGCASSMRSLSAHCSKSEHTETNSLHSCMCTCMWMYTCKSGAEEAEAQRVNSGEVGAELDLGGDGTSTPASTAAGKATKDGHPALAIAGNGCWFSTVL